MYSFLKTESDTWPCHRIFQGSPIKVWMCSLKPLLQFLKWRKALSYHSPEPITWTDNFPKKLFCLISNFSLSLPSLLLVWRCKWSKSGNTRSHTPPWKACVPVPSASLWNVDMLSIYFLLGSFEPLDESEAKKRGRDKKLSFNIIIKKAECRRIDAFELWCWRRLLRVPWTARRSNQSILKEINPENSLEGLMLKLKLQYFGHLIWRADSLEKILMLEKNEGGRRRGRQRMGWLNGIINPMDMGLSKLQEIVKDREAWHAAVQRVAKSHTWLSDLISKRTLPIY